jgi:NAD(P)-dependent dehydrogenase (short-subunit alcohol dehydrogenase family)
MQNLLGKTAVITGGGSGMGRSMCLSFADEGMDIVVADIELSRAHATADEVTGRGRRAVAVRCDVADRAAVSSLAQAAHGAFGAVHVLCNNAGVYVAGLIQDMEYADWDWVTGVNYDGVVNGIQEFLPGMIAQGEGHIVNTASMAGIIPSARGLGMYTATKYAIVGLSECLVVDLKGTGVGVSVLCPGAVATNIGRADRNRPPGMARQLPLDPSFTEEIIPRLEHGLDPSKVGPMVVRGVKEEWLYIFTDTSLRGLVERRFSRILTAFDAQS